MGLYLCLLTVLGLLYIVVKFPGALVFLVGDLDASYKVCVPRLGNCQNVPLKLNLVGVNWAIV